MHFKKHMVLTYLKQILSILSLMVHSCWVLLKNVWASQVARCRRCGFGPWARKIPWRRKQQPIPVLLPGKSHGQRSLVGYSTWGCKRVRHDLVNNNNKYTSPSASVLGTSLTPQGTGLQTHHGLLGCVSVMNFTPRTTLLKPWGVTTQAGKIRLAFS